MSILLWCQISIMTSHPVVIEGEQKQNALYRDIATSSVIRDENTGSNDRKNGTLNTYSSLLSAHARMVRSNEDCRIIEASDAVFPCGNVLVKTVKCRKASLGCAGYGLTGGCQEIKTAYRCNGKFYTFVTGCQCSA